MNNSAVDENGQFSSRSHGLIYVYILIFYQDNSLRQSLYEGMEERVNVGCCCCVCPFVHMPICLFFFIFNTYLAAGRGVQLSLKIKWKPHGVLFWELLLEELRATPAEIEFLPSGPAHTQLLYSGTAVGDRTFVH